MKNPVFTDVNIPCAICEGTQSVERYHFSFSEHHYPGTFTLRQCVRCGVLFNSPRLSDEEITKLYNKNYYFFNRKPSSEFHRIVDVYSRSVALVEKDVAIKRVLEIGGAKGYLLAVLQGLGWAVTEVEISHAASAYAKKHFKISTYTGTIESFAAQSDHSQFPLVLAIDLIEHVTDPRAFLASVAAVVEKKGFLIIDTPNADAYNITAQGTAWGGFNPFHIYLYTVRTLMPLLDRYGFTLVRAFSYNNVPAVAPRGVYATLAKMKALVRTIALKLHLFKLVKSVINIEIPSKNDKILVSSAVSSAKDVPPYFVTADAQCPLARRIAGDNIVIIAQKK